MNDKHNFLIIGHGRIAQHLKYVLGHILGDSSVVQSDFKLQSSNFNSRHQLMTSIDYFTESHSSFAKELTNATHVCLAVSDRSLAMFDSLAHDLNQHPHFKNKFWLHFSGSLTFSNILDLHPLGSFTHEPWDLEKYKSLHFVSTRLRSWKDMDLQAQPGVELPSIHHIDPELKTLYHAWCVMGGNFSTLLWQWMSQALQTLDIPKEASHFYLDTLIQNFKTNPAKALTGPLVRQDIKTMQNHLKELEGTAFSQLYQSFMETYQDLTSKSTPVKLREEDNEHL